MDITSVQSLEELFDLLRQTDEDGEVLRFLRENHLAKSNGKRCCSKAMTEGKYVRDKWFGKRWRCTMCKKARPVLHGTVFSGSHLHPFTVLKIAYLYVALQLNQTAITRVLKTKPSAIVLCSWTQFCRNVLSKDLLRELRVQKLGGQMRTVVIDKTSLQKQKRNQEGPRSIETTWILGIYDVEAKVGILDVILNGSDEEIVSKVEATVEKDSEIVTNDTQTYICLETKGYTHRTLNRSHSFVSPYSTHANHVKGYFSRLKTFLRKKCAKRQDIIPSYLDEFMWRERNSDDVWKRFIQAVQRQYPC